MQMDKESPSTEKRIRANGFWMALCPKESATETKTISFLLLKYGRKMQREGALTMSMLLLLSYQDLIKSGKPYLVQAYFDSPSEIISKIVLDIR